MPKISVDELKNISSRGREVKLPCEKGGEETEITLRIYPFTVKEKASYKSLGDEIKEISKTKGEDSEEFANKNEELTNQMVYDVLKKSVDGLTMDFVKNNIPAEWYEKLISEAMKSEGLTDEQIEQAKKEPLQAGQTK